MRHILFIGILLIAGLFTQSSCLTEQERARKYGGETTVHLPANQKLVFATWKDADLWYGTRPMRSDENPETITMLESKAYSTLSGTVKFVESKK